MALHEKKVFHLYRILNLLAIGTCIYLAVFVSPLKEVLLPPLKRFVVANIDALINIIWLTFVIGSTALIVIFWWIYDSDKKYKSRAKAYISKLVVKNYYKGAKRVDYYKAVKTALSKYSRQIPGEEDQVAGSVDVKTSDAEKARVKLIKARAAVKP